MRSASTLKRPGAPPSSTLEWGPSGTVLGTSWTFLGGSWTPLDASWPPPGRLLGALGTLLGASWLSWVPPGSILGGFEGVRARFCRALGDDFGKHFAYNRWLNIVHESVQKSHCGIYFGFSFSPCSAAVRALCAHGIGAKLAKNLCQT